MPSSKPYAPAISKYKAMGMNVGTPSVRTGFAKDIYLTLEPPVKPTSESAKIKVFVKPMILWLWIAGGVMALGTLFALIPSRRRSEDDES